MSLNLKKTLPLAGLALALTAGSAFAQATPVDNLKTETDKLKNVYESVVPYAIGAGVFAIGFSMVKRVAYA